MNMHRETDEFIINALRKNRGIGWASGSGAARVVLPAEGGQQQLADGAQGL
jgi:hypothetical protein